MPPLFLAPNQAVYLATVAQRTKRLRLSTLVYVLPLHNPIRLNEELCLIDQLSNGRFGVGVGRSTDRAQEWRMRGGDASKNDAGFEETLEVVLHALANQYLGFAYHSQGDFRRAIDCLGQTAVSLDGAGRRERFGAVFLPAVHSRVWLAWCHAELGTFTEDRVACSGPSHSSNGLWASVRTRTSRAISPGWLGP